MFLNQSILKEIKPEYSLEGLMLKLKLQFSGHLMQRANSLEKTLMLGKIKGRRRRETHRMRWLDGRLSRQTIVVQSLSCVQLFVTQWTAVCQASLFFTISQSLLRFMSTESVTPSNQLTLCHPLLLLPSVFPSIRNSSNELTFRNKWPKYWSFSFSISPSSEYSGLISFKIDWFDLLADKGTLNSLLQCHNSKVSILWCSAFVMVQLSHPYMTTGKTIGLTI